ncbi:MAG: Phosphoglycolate phosphatase [Syntrophaceae bacterium PtaB.Bin038]|nr:MAG: Phosphoglycolate phosphatase [Syntrophaceae bacterium PtaB.Bin038]
MPDRMLRLEAVVFDFDGTLALLNIDFRAMRRDIVDLASSYGIGDDGMERLFVLEMIEEMSRRIGRKSPGRQGAFSDLALRRVADRELAGAAYSFLFPDVRKMLAELRRRGIKTGVLTRNCLEAVRAVFPDIGNYSDAVVTRDDTERVKPHPDHIRAVLRLLDAEPSTSAMVGDHPMDIRVGKAVGALAVGVLTGYSAAADLREAGADLILERAAEITCWLE